MNQAGFTFWRRYAAPRTFLVFVSFILIIAVSISPNTRNIGYNVNYLAQSASIQLMTKTSPGNGSEGTKAGYNENFFYENEMEMPRSINAISFKGRKHIDHQTKRISLKPKHEQAKLRGEKCIKTNITLSQIMLPITGLVSFPGSGNTWTRHLIQQMTGLATSSVYCDKVLKMRGFPYECHHNKSETVIVKTHGTRHIKMFTKIVLLMRNPYDAILSYSHYMSRHDHVSLLSKADLIKVSNNVFNMSLKWYVHLASVIITEFRGPVHIIQYEALQTNMSSELRKLASFLDVNVTDEDINCTVKLQEGNFHRLVSQDRHIELLRVVYKKEQILRLQETAHYIAALIERAYGITIDLIGKNGKTQIHEFLHQK